MIGIASTLAFMVALLNCATLTGLRALRDRSTVAVRAALGAGHRDIWSEALIRHLGTSVLAAALALLALGPLSGAILGLVGSSSIKEFDVSARADWSTVVLTAGVAVFAAIVLTVVESATLALAVRRPTILRETRMTHSRTTSRLLQAVTVGQLVASIVVVTGAVLVTQGYFNQVHGERGFVAQDLWLVDVGLPSGRYPDTVRRLEYVDRVVGTLRATPGVIGASSATTTPDEGGSWGAAYLLPGQQPPALGYHLTNHRLVSAGYFETMSIPLLSGRDSNRADFAPDTLRSVPTRCSHLRSPASRPSTGCA